MGILQALFGSQVGQQGMQSGFTPVNQMPQTQQQQAPQTLGLVQNILSQRFNPQPQDVAQSIFMNGTGLGTNGGITTPEAQTVQRLAPVMDIAKTLGTLNQSQLEIAKLNEQMRHDQATELQNPYSQPITTSPTTIGGAQPPSQTIPGAPHNIPTMMQNNAPQSNAAPVSIPQQMSGNRTQLQATGSNTLPSGQSDTAASVYGDNKGSDPTDNPSIRQTTTTTTTDPMAYDTSTAPKLTPLYRGNVPYKDGLPDGYQWAQDPQGNMVATQIAGVPQKGDAGVILSTDPATGKTTQSIPVNPQARAKFETNIQKIAGLFDQLHKAGGSVEQGGNFLGNKVNQLAGTQGVTVEGVPLLPGGQTVMQGTETQAIRDEIQGLIKQTTPLYMQAMGITPGMERAASAQQMLQEALGGSVVKSRQANQYQLANLSQQAGTGEYNTKFGTLQAARDAVANGADAKAVEARLQSVGIDPQELQ